MKYQRSFICSNDDSYISEPYESNKTKKEELIGLKTELNAWRFILVDDVILNTDDIISAGVITCTSE